MSMTKDRKRRRINVHGPLFLTVLGMVLALAAFSVFLVLTEPEVETPVLVQEASKPVVTEDPAVARDVTPDKALPGPSVSGPLTRLPDRQPPPPPPRPPKPQLLNRVIVVDAGAVRKGKTTIRFIAIDPLQLSARCTDPDGHEWPCGQAAATELKMLVRRKSLGCGLPIGDSGEAALEYRHCRVGHIDIGEWLIRQGWASPGNDAPQAYIDAFETAKDEQRGQYGKAWGRD